MKKSISRVLSVVLVGAVLWSTSLPVFAEDKSLPTLGYSEPIAYGIIDTTPPVFQGIKLEKSVAIAPDTISVEAFGTDDISGVMDIYLHFSDPISGKFIDCYFSEYNDFISEIKISNHHPSGTYTLSYASITDRAENRQIYATNLTQWQIDDGYLPLTDTPSITVTNNHAVDNTKPVLGSVSFDNTTITAPNSIKVTATATDDTKVRHIEIGFANSSANRDLSVYLSDDEETGTFTGELYTGDYLPAGTYECDFIRVTDEAGNEQRYGADLEQWQIADGWLPLPAIPNITVINNNPADTTPPKILSLSLSKSELNTPDKLTVTATASDDISGVRYIFIEFMNSQEQTSLYAYLTDEYGTGLFTDTIETGLYDLPGVYDCAYISVSDDAQNEQRYVLEPDDWQLQYGYLPLPFALSFTVINDGKGAYIPPPTINYSSNSTSSSDSKGTSKADTTPEINLSKLGKAKVNITTNKVKALFNKQFTNILEVIYVDKVGNQSIKLDLSKLHGNNLTFYHYRPAENKYYLIKNPNYTVTKSGDFQFHAAIAGYIVITDKPLQSTR